MGLEQWAFCKMGMASKIKWHTAGTNFAAEELQDDTIITMVCCRESSIVLTRTREKVGRKELCVRLANCIWHLWGKNAPYRKWLKILNCSSLWHLRRRVQLLLLLRHIMHSQANISGTRTQGPLERLHWNLESNAGLAQENEPHWSKHHHNSKYMGEVENFDKSPLSGAAV